jgi:hypothetical protein
MKLVLAFVIAGVLAASSGCVTMEDCCECLAQAEVLDCTEPYEECVQGCFELCEPTRACYCSDARQVGCEAECGCEL